jgi:hypothetical protein
LPDAFHGQRGYFRQLSRLCISASVDLEFFVRASMHDNLTATIAATKREEKDFLKHAAKTSTNTDVHFRGDYSSPWDVPGIEELCDILVGQARKSFYRCVWNADMFTCCHAKVALLDQVSRENPRAFVLWVDAGLMRDMRWKRVNGSPGL